MPQITTYDDDTIEYVAWGLAEKDGFRHGRCLHFEDEYVQQVRDILTALDIAAEMQGRGEL